MLLNISNHPSNKWSKQQKDTAIKQFGTAQDLPFPQIPPEASSDDVCKLVEAYVSKVRESDANVVHVMGEMTFTCALVNALQAIGIPCIASTTRRQVLEEDDGKKTSIFEFVQFRSYINHIV